MDTSNGDSFIDIGGVYIDGFYFLRISSGSVGLIYTSFFHWIDICNQNNTRLIGGKK